MRFEPHGGSEKAENSILFICVVIKDHPFRIHSGQMFWQTLAPRSRKGILSKLSVRNLRESPLWRKRESDGHVSGFCNLHRCMWPIRRLWRKILPGKIPWRLWRTIKNMFSSSTGPHCAVSFQFLLMCEVCSVLNSETPTAPWEHQGLCFN